MEAERTFGADEYRAVEDDREVVKRMPHMPEAMDLLERAVENLQKQASMLEERLAPGYLRPPGPERDGTTPADPERELVPMAEAIKRLAWRVARTTDGLGDLRERFEG